MGRAIDVVGDMDVELDFVRETVIKRHDAEQGPGTWGQNCQDVAIPARIGDEAVLATVLRTERSNADRIGRRWIRECGIRIETRSLEDGDPGAVLPIWNQTRQTNADGGTPWNAFSLYYPVGIVPLTSGDLMAVRRNDG